MSIDTSKSSAPAAARGGWMNAVAMAAIAVVCAWLRWSADDLACDDAYITLAMSRHLVVGDGLVFNTGERLLSSTSPVYAVAVAGVAYVGRMNPQRAGQMLNVASSIGICFLVAALVRRLSGSRCASAGAALLFAVAPSSVMYSLLGMETPFYACFLLGAVALAASGRLYAAAVIAAFLPWIRPDGAVVSVLVALHILAVRRTKAVRELAVMGSIAGLVALALTLYYGSPVPHSLMQKVRFFREQFNVGLLGFMRQWAYHIYSLYFDDTIINFKMQSTKMSRILPGAAIMFGLGAVALVHAIRRDRSMIVTLLAPLCLCGFFIAGGAGLPWPWYFCSTDPFFIIASMGGLALLVARIARMRQHGSAGGEEKFSAIAVGLIVSLLAVSTLAARYDWQRHGLPRTIDDHRPPHREPAYKQAAEFMNRENLDPTNLVLCCEVGALGYFARYKTWDGDLTTPYPVSALSREQLALKYRPRFISFIGLYPFAPGFASLDDEVALGPDRYRKTFSIGPEADGLRHKVVVYEREIPDERRTP